MKIERKSSGESRRDAGGESRRDGGAAHRFRRGDEPAELRSAVRTLLASPLPILLAWGPELALLYNDAFRPILSGKHPAALGRPARAVFREVWPALGPRLEGVLASGESVLIEDLELLLERGSRDEERYFTFAASAVRDEAGSVLGVLAQAVENTSQVIEARRLKVVLDLACACARARDPREPEEVCRIAADALARDPRDVPFAALYLVEDRRVRLAACAGIEPGSAAAPELVDWSDSDWLPRCPWPLRAVAEKGEPARLEHLEERFGALPRGAWQVAPSTGVVLPVRAREAEAPCALLVAALSPHVPERAAGVEFLEQIATLAGDALGGASSPEPKPDSKYGSRSGDPRSPAVANDELDQIVYAASHDLREPVRMVVAFTQLLQRRYGARLDDEAGRLIHFAVEGAQRMELHLDALLAYSRAGRDVGPLEPHVDARAVAGEALVRLRERIREAGAVITLGELPEMRVRELDLRQLFERLLENALEYRREAPPAIELCAKRGKRDWTFAVRDNGLGIEPEHTQAVFRMFKRLHGAGHRGTGMGLAICHKIVSRYGGRMWVESEPGVGSTFYFTLPA